MTGIEFLSAEDKAWEVFPKDTTELTEVLVFDTETTGIDHIKDRIVTAHLSIVKRGNDEADPNALDVLIDAGVEISDSAAEVHGVTNEKRIAEGAPEEEGLALIAGKLQEAIDNGIPLVAFNGVFDFSMLHNSMSRLGLEPLTLERAVIFDPFVLDKTIDKFRKGKRQLVHVAEHYGVPFDNAHEASADAVAAGRVLFAILDKFGGALPLNTLSKSMQRHFRSNAISFEDYLRKIGKLDTPLNKHWPVSVQEVED